MELTGGGVATGHAGTWSAGSGATIVFNEGEYHLGSSATFEGAIELTSGAHVSAQQIHGTNARVSVTPNATYTSFPTVLDIEGPAPSTIATLNVEGARGWEIINTAVLTGAGEVDVTRSFTGGTFAYLEGTGTTVIKPGANAAVSSSLGLDEQHKLENAGTLTMSEGASIGGARDGTLINTGTLDKPEGAGTATIASPFKNEGAVNVSSGTLELTGGGTSADPHSSTWSASEGAKLAFNSREAFALGSSVDLAGTVEISEGPVTAETIDGAAASVTINGWDWSNRGTLEVNGATPSTLSKLTVNGGRVAGSGTVSVANAFVGESDADLSGVGTLELQAGANGSISGTVDIEERTLDNAGTLTIGAQDRLDGSHHTRVLNSGTLNVNGESPAGDEHGLVASTGEATVVNMGVIAKTEGSWPALIGFAIDNDGTINAESGTLEFTGGGESAEFASDTWTAAPGAAIELNGISSGATYSLGATATINGSMHLDDNVTAGTIKGSGASLTTLHSILTLTGLTPSELGSLTFLEAPPDYWFPQIQHVTVASELDIDNSLTWSSSNAVFDGPGAIVTKPGSTTVFDAGSARFDGGQFINEGTATWETGQLADEVDEGTFFINYGTFHANAQGFEPLVPGCSGTPYSAHQCPTFENDGLFTADLPHIAEGDLPAWPHIAWQVNILNYGDLDVPYRKEYVCPLLPPYGWTSEACVEEQQRIRETYAGLLLKEGAEVIEPPWEVWITGSDEEGQVLTANTSSLPWRPAPSISYQWQRCGGEEEGETLGGECKDIEGATSPTLELNWEDVGRTVRLDAEARNSRGVSRTSQSAATTVVRRNERTEPEEENVEAAPHPGQGASTSEGENCRTSEAEDEHCYGLIESPFVGGSAGFLGSAVEIDPTCLADHGDGENFSTLEQWVSFPTIFQQEAEHLQDWTEAGILIGRGVALVTILPGESVGEEPYTWSYPVYFVGDKRTLDGHPKFHEHDSGVRAPLDKSFKDVIWFVGGTQWAAAVGGFDVTSSPQPEVARKLEAGTENSANDMSSSAYLRNFEYETRTKGTWRSGWSAEHHEMVENVTPEPPHNSATAKVTSKTTGEVSFNSGAC